MKKSAILLPVLMLLYGLFAPNIALSALTGGGDLTAVAKVNISSDSLKDIVSGVHQSQQLTIHGTEYKAGEVATIFLQLKDENNYPILNGTCYLDMFSPNKSQVLNNVPMLYLANSDGIYFYDYNLPASTGLYMVSAQCTYSQFIRHYYTLTGGGWNPFEATSCEAEKINISVSSGGTPLGTPTSLNNLMDWVYVYIDSSAGGTKAINATFLFNGTEQRCKINKSNIQSLNFYYLGESYNPITMNFYALNWTTNSWMHLGAVATAGTASTTATTGIEDYFSAKLDVNNYTNSDGSVKIMAYATAGAGFANWFDWLGLVASGNTTTMVDLKGSGEIHLSGAEGIYEDCSIMTDKDSYLPSETAHLTYFSGTAPTRLKIILLNGSSYYDSGLMNGTGAFSYSFTTPSAKQSIMLELLCGNSFAHKYIVIDKGFWDIPFEPLIILLFAFIVIIVLVFIGRYRE
jgi:hypothetical protein